ncbi:enoyl-CoA hydratase-related protein [Gammaproteobacteria bacterium]|nr:enoyl-CoA hydratase-related protein [Gammaproteobacteria bacterium]
MIELEKKESIYHLCMNAGENRWNTSFVRQFAEALDEIEKDEGPGALVTSSKDPKFFSNGLDLDWMQNPESHPQGGDREVFGEEFMFLMGRIITLPIPSICLINGHAFGAGFMLALSHDVRLMRKDRGFLCANEMELGFEIPRPELALFRHKIPANYFFETVQLSKRWTGETALKAGIVQGNGLFEELPKMAIDRAKEIAPLASDRKLYAKQKEMLYGENSAINLQHGPAHMLKNSKDFEV